jgi:hypothetical protein
VNYFQDTLYHFDGTSLSEYNTNLYFNSTFADYFCYSSTRTDNPSFLVDEAFATANHYYNPSFIDQYHQAFQNNSSGFPFLFDIEFNLSRSVPTPVVNTVYRNRISVNAPESLYPIATRYISQSGYLVVERPPFQIDIDYKVGRASSHTKKRLTNRKLWIPWTIFVFNPSYPQGYKYFFSDSSLLNTDHKYISPYIPNTYLSGDICFSNSLSHIPEDSLPDSSDISHFYSTVFNDFFSGGWNSDLTNPWNALISSITSQIHAKRISKESISQDFPTLYTLLYPQEEVLAPILSKSSSLRSYYQYANKSNYTFLSLLDIQNFHYVILYTLSTLDLSDILKLISEVFELSEKTNFVHKQIVHTFSNIMSSLEENLQDNLHFNVKLALDKAIEFNPDSATFFTNFSTKILVLNTPSTYSHYNYPKHIPSYFASAYFSQEAYMSICHKILSDLSSEIPPSQRVYVYDYDSKNVNSHMINSSLESLYLTLLNNNFHIPSILSPFVPAESNS